MESGEKTKELSSNYFQNSKRLHKSLENVPSVLAESLLISPCAESFNILPFWKHFWSELKAEQLKYVWNLNLVPRSELLFSGRLHRETFTKSRFICCCMFSVSFRQRPACFLYKWCEPNVKIQKSLRHKSNCCLCAKYSVCHTCTDTTILIRAL